MSVLASAGVIGIGVMSDFYSQWLELPNSGKRSFSKWVRRSWSAICLHYRAY
jgi:hypothetical protein